MVFQRVVIPLIAVATADTEFWLSVGCLNIHNKLEPSRRGKLNLLTPDGICQSDSMKIFKTMLKPRARFDLQCPDLVNGETPIPVTRLILQTGFLVDHQRNGESCPAD